MIHSAREAFNSRFSEKKYGDLLQRIEKMYPGALDFRIAETPVFIPAVLRDQMLDACENIIDTILDPSFLSMTERSIPENLKVPGPEGLPEFMVFDFGICRGANGQPEPKLIEMQGFPSLFAYQALLSELMRDYGEIGDAFSSYLNGYDKDAHERMLKQIIVGNHDPEEVVLLEIFPEKQKTRIDFHCTRDLLGIETVCFTRIQRKGDQLFYDKGGKQIRIKRIFNRMIFDDLHRQHIKEPLTDLSVPYDVEWIPHPNWFYRISKYTLPYLTHPCIPESWFLYELKQPVPLQDYVLKPLFSFAGTGVKLDVTEKDLEDIQDPENWILQKKVEYLPVIPTPDDPAKLEVRLFYYLEPGSKRPVAVHNLARLSKGAMIGTRYNLNRSWVGGTIAFFEK